MYHWYSIFYGSIVYNNNNNIASRDDDDDDGGWYDYLQRQNVQLREMMCEMSEEI